MKFTVLKKSSMLTTLLSAVTYQVMFPLLLENKEGTSDSHLLLNMHIPLNDSSWIIKIIMKTTTIAY